MDSVLISPAGASLLGIPAPFFFLLIPVIGVTTFIFILAKRSAPLVRANPDPRGNRPVQRFWVMVKYAIGQYRHPRYMSAGVLHIILFSGFMILSLRSITLVLSARSVLAQRAWRNGRRWLMGMIGSDYGNLEY